MQSIAARIGAGRMLLAGLAVVAVLVASGLTTGNKPLRERDRTQNVISLDGASAPAAGATASAGVADTEAASAFVEDRSKVEHHAAIDPSEAGATADDGISPGAPSDAEVRKALKQLERSSGGVPGERAVLNRDGTAEAPFSAPDRVARVIAAANAIAKFPYIWGGGHGSFQDNGYDCSGSVSYALAGGGLLKAPMASGAFENYGKPGPGRWITIYANGGHMYMVVAGLRYDTSGRSGPRGTRWNQNMRPSAGFVVRHPPGF